MALRLLFLLLAAFLGEVIASEAAILETARRTHHSVDEVRKHHIEGCASGITGQMNICAEYHFVESDLRLNEIYKRLMGRFSDKAETKAKLVKAQRAWVAFRDLECELESDGWSGGTGWGVINLTCKTTLTKARTKELQEYLDCTGGCPGDGYYR